MGVFDACFHYGHASSTVEPVFLSSADVKNLVSLASFARASTYWGCVVAAARSKNIRNTWSSMYFIKQPPKWRRKIAFCKFKKNTMLNSVEIFQKIYINIFKYPAFQICQYAV